MIGTRRIGLEELSRWIVRIPERRPETHRHSGVSTLAICTRASTSGQSPSTRYRERRSPVHKTPRDSSLLERDAGRSALMSAAVFSIRREQQVETGPASESSVAFRFRAARARAIGKPAAFAFASHGVLAIPPGCSPDQERARGPLAGQSTSPPGAARGLELFPQPTFSGRHSRGRLPGSSRFRLHSHSQSLPG